MYVLLQGGLFRHWASVPMGISNLLCIIVLDLDNFEKDIVVLHIEKNLVFIIITELI